jgi:SAM-dependent methyltransferase
VPSGSGVYYGSHYWNDLPRVVRYIAESCTGDPDKWWMDDFKERFCSRGPFAHGLFPNCGNGWVEREFIDRGIVRRATAFDYAQDLLDLAAAEQGERDISYFQADVNRVDFPADAFDLVVNVGALHHVQYVNRLARLLCQALTADGVLVAFDYVGPARNQYPARQWRLIRRANRALPEFLRKQPLDRPHLPTMLAEDPTEAIHADLVLAALARYFRVVERHDTGGGIAYEVITHNPRFFDAARAAEIQGPLDRLLATDRELTAAGEVPPLFAYYIARPDKSALGDPRAGAWQTAEDRREAWAAAHLGTYTGRDFARVRARRAVSAALRRVGLGGVRARLRRALR